MGSNDRPDGTHQDGNDARYAIIEALRNGELRFDELSKAVRAAGFTQSSFERARAQLHDEGNIERLGGGAAGPLRWQLTPFSRSPSASLESAAASESGRKKHGWRNFAIIVGIFLVGFFALLIVVGNYAQDSEQETSYMTRPGGTFTPEPADTPSATPEPQTPSAFGDGQVAEIGAGGIGLPCFATKEGLDAFIDAETKHDSYGAGEALTNAVTLHRGEHVRAISHAGFLDSIIQIRVESGDDEGAACWLPSDAAGLFVNIRDD